LHDVLDHKPALSRFSNALKINALSFISLINRGHNHRTYSLLYMAFLWHWRHKK